MLSKFPDGRNSLSLFMALATFLRLQNKEINNRSFDASMVEKSLGTVFRMFIFLGSAEILSYRMEFRTGQEHLIA